MASAAWDVRVLWRNQAVTEHHTCMLASSSSVKAGQFLDWAGSLGQGRWHTTRQPALSMDSSLRAEGSTCSARRVDLRSCGGCERGAQVPDCRMDTLVRGYVATKRLASFLSPACQAAACRD